MDESQLLKGILEGCVLKIISQEETYGYDILLKLSDAGLKNIIEGTLIPYYHVWRKKSLFDVVKQNLHLVQLENIIR